jgi:hypothetical protein
MRDLTNTPYNEFVWFVGSIESIEDPDKLGRVRVRAFGFHDEFTPVDKLPLAFILDGATPAVTGVQTAVGFFMDGKLAQQPFILGLMNSTASYPGRVDSTPTGTTPSTASGRASPRPQTVPSDSPQPNIPEGPIIVEDNKEFWTLVAICGTEDSDRQSWADVAQSIYNRMNAGVFGGSTATSVILARNQYQPTWLLPQLRSPNTKTQGSPNREWTNINNIADAAIATGKSQQYLLGVAKAIKDQGLQNNAKTFIKSYTDFRGTTVVSNWTTDGGVSRSNRNNTFGFAKSSTYRGAAGQGPIPGFVIAAVIE